MKKLLLLILILGLNCEKVRREASEFTMITGNTFDESLEWSVIFNLEEGSMDIQGMYIQRQLVDYLLSTTESSIMTMSYNKSRSELCEFYKNPQNFLNVDDSRVVIRLKNCK